VALLGLQNPGLALPRDSGGLRGLQRQGMDLRKKGGAAQAEFVGATTRLGAGTITWPVGAAAGNVAIIFSMHNAATPVLSTGGWVKATYTFAVTAFAILHIKTLTDADVSVPPTLDLAIDGVHCLLYRGPASAVARTAMESAAGVSDLSIPGFVKNPAHLGVVNVSMDRVDGATSTPAGTPPVAMIIRSNTLASAGPNNLLSGRSADLLGAQAYASTVAFDWTAYDTSAGYSQLGVAIELMG
jgi:hypothetical protein